MFKSENWLPPESHDISWFSIGLSSFFHVSYFELPSRADLGESSLRSFGQVHHPGRGAATALVVPSGKRLHNELERSTMLWKWVNQLFNYGPFSSSQTVWNYQRVVPNLYFLLFGSDLGWELGVLRSRNRGLALQLLSLQRCGGDLVMGWYSILSITYLPSGND